MTQQLQAAKTVATTVVTRMRDGRKKKKTRKTWLLKILRSVIYTS
jgi:hypothetical protein